MLECMKRKETLFNRIGAFLLVHFSARYSSDEILMHLKKMLPEVSISLLLPPPSSFVHRFTPQQSIRRRTIPALSAFGVPDEACMGILSCDDDDDKVLLEEEKN